MLVLSRKISESIVITVPGYPHPIVVAVVSQVPGKTKIGIQAPGEVIVDRSEVHADKITQREARRLDFTPRETPVEVCS